MTEKYCSRCRTKRAVILKPAGYGYRGKAECATCGHSWPVGKAKS